VHALAPARGRSVGQDDDVVGETGAGQLLLEFEHDALRDLAADAGDQAEGGEIVASDGPAQRRRRVHAEHRLREPRADAGRGLQELENRAFVVVGEAVERERVFADDKGRRQPGFLADPHLRDGGRCAIKLDAEAANFDNDRVGGDGGDSTGHERDHRCATARTGVAAAIRASAAPRQIWQIARASASVASAGATSPGVLSNLRTMNAT